MAADLAGLTARLPPGTLITDRDLLASYRQDWAQDPNAGWPVAVVRATCTADVQAVVSMPGVLASSNAG